MNTPAGRILRLHGSLLLALLLTLTPLPGSGLGMWPEWPALVLAWWCAHHPGRVGLGTALAWGLLLDLALGTLLGQHALGLLWIAYVVLRQHSRFRLYPLLQQALVVAALVAVERLVFLWLYGIADRPVQQLGPYALPVLSSALVWPLIDGSLRRWTR
ncbi:MAG: rod shape-determining protein MreD [Gammaproteobacteria bacterium]|nr:MAG: rod shape-determining protein MreD [Gammaproteobacteria bacterium]